VIIYYRHKDDSVTCDNMINEDTNWDLISFIMSSKYRYEVLKKLYKTQSTPSILSKKTKISINHISNILRELMGKNLVKCLTPDKRKGRIYNITDLGREIQFKIEKMLSNNFKLK